MRKENTHHLSTDLHACQTPTEFTAVKFNAREYCSVTLRNHHLFLKRRKKHTPRSLNGFVSLARGWGCDSWPLRRTFDRIRKQRSPCTICTPPVPRDYRDYVPVNHRQLPKEANDINVESASPFYFSRWQGWNPQRFRVTVIPLSNKKEITAGVTCAVRGIGNTNVQRTMWLFSTNLGQKTL